MELEKRRVQVIHAIGNSLFLCDLARTDLPPVNPLDTYALAHKEYVEFRRKHPLAIKIALGSASAASIAGILFIAYAFYYELLPNPILILLSKTGSGTQSPSSSSWFDILYFGITTIATLALVVVPLVFWSTNLYRRIQLTVFSDYLKKSIIRELTILLSYYQLIQSRVSARDASLVRVAIQDITGRTSSIRKPHFLRNVLLTSASTVIGLVGTISTLITGHSDLELIAPSLGELGKAVSELPVWQVMILVLTTEFILMFLTVIPLINGIRSSMRYGDRYLKPNWDAMRRTMVAGLNNLPSYRTLELVPGLRTRGRKT